MFEVTTITELSNIQREYFISDINIRSSDGVIVLYVPNERVSEVVRTGFVSKRQLENLATKLTEKYSVNVEFIYTEANKLEQFGQGVETLLKAKYGNLIEEIDITFLTASKVNAWIKNKNLDESQKKIIESYLISIFFDSDVTDVDVQWVGEIDRLPSFMEVLIMTKKLQPVLLSTYVSNFSADYQSINDKWLNRQLDKLIKKGLVIRDNTTKEYSLTGKGLGVIPNVLSRTNSDISRALDLGRRKW